MNNGIFAAMVAIMMVATLTSSGFAHISDQKRYNDGYDPGQNYAGLRL